MQKTIALFTLLVFNYCFSQENSTVLNIYFSNNSSHLSSKSKKDLQTLIDLSTKDSIIIEELIGYCDVNGSEESNKELAVRRISSVQNFLSSYPIIIQKITAAGENYPIGSKRLNDLANWRRAEIHYRISKENTERSSLPNQFSSIKIDSLHSNNFKPIVLKINFMPGMDVLLENSHQEIENLFQFLKANENVFAFIRGHVCCADDFPLSTTRAYVVYSILVERGISPSRLKYQGFSNTKPAISPEVIEEHRIRNRRVDVIFSIID